MTTYLERLARLQAIKDAIAAAEIQIRHEPRSEADFSYNRGVLKAIDAVRALL
jgi:hypothetical protein